MYRYAGTGFQYCCDLGWPEDRRKASQALKQGALRSSLRWSLVAGGLALGGGLAGGGQQPEGWRGGGVE